MREFFRLVLVLGFVGFISGGALGAFYDYTAPIVEERRLQEVMVTMKGIFPDAERIKEMPETPAEVPGKMYKAFGSDGKQLGIALVTVAKGGYVGDIGLIFGIEPESRKIIAVDVTEHQETPGLGSKIEEPGFLDQFRGKSILDKFQIGQDLDGITMATISARAVASAVGLQSRAVLRHLGQDIDEPAPPPQVAEPPPVEEPVVIDLAVVASELWPGKGVVQLNTIAAPAAFTVTEKVYLAKSEQEELLGLLLVVEGIGYGGPMRLAVGVDKDLAKLTGIRLLENNETPNLGTKIGEEPFISQFVGKGIKDPFVLGQDVDGITMATISAQGVVDVVREKARIAADHFRNRLGS
jgi:electron transport complex protein RnfG